MDRLSALCTTLYAELLDRACGPAGRLPPGGSFGRKTVGDKVYWYYHTRQVEGHRAQIALGRETDALLAKIAQWRSAQADATEQITARKKLVHMLGTSGAQLELGRPAKLLRRMSEAGVFEAGGVLVGSFAFATYGNMLGVRLGSELMRTSDRDLSLLKDVDIGLSRSIPAELQRDEPDLIWPRQLLPSSPPFSLVAPDGFKVEFLTPAAGPTDKTPVLIDRFSVHAMPLRYLDYLLDEPEDAVVLYGSGIAVKVPNPARYALHKLAVSELRPLGEKAKSDKDIRQSAQLLEILLDDRPGAVMAAAEAVNLRDDDLSISIRGGMQRLPAEQRSAIGEMLIPKQWDMSTGKAEPD